MKAPYAIALLVAIGLAGCKAEVTPAGPTGSTSSTTIVKEKEASPPANVTVTTPPATPTSTETTSRSTTVDTPAGTASKTTTTTTTK